MLLRRLCGNDKKEIATSLVCIFIITFVLLNLNDDSFSSTGSKGPQQRASAPRKAGDVKWRWPTTTTAATTTPHLEVDAHIGNITLHAYKPIAFKPDLTREQLETLFHDAVKTIHVTCRSSKRFGRQGDGGYDICLAEPYIDNAHFCLLYSFGVGHIWGFDTDVANLLGCEVRAFDPFIGEAAQRRGLRFWFFDQGLSDTETVNSDGKRMRTFIKLTEEFGHMKRWIDIVKIDIEQNEWAVLDSMLRDGSIAQVKQLIVELHLDEFRSSTTSAARFAYFLGVLRRLEQNGFRRWRSALNERGRFPAKLYDRDARSCCYEQYFVNLNYLSKPSRFKELRKPESLRPI